ncbi:twin-arginine translocation pathway signal [Sphingomonas sp. Leaf33]|uniref:DUF885 domain-containing protein n=1 Tax=Sphingomonas sp. Leaf33 TaxID=1736215 RepID=UPI0006F843DE|nr:DUF885 family protein [Sphingomonas sp. Leaf33]KQN26256.1 twin-arginine translocation pathway signal [Sphingomonas sp. Leaf33]
MTLSRRDMLAASAGSTLLAALPATARTPVTTIDTLADEWLRLSPDTATSLGIDTGPRAALRGQLSDPGPAGVARVHAWVGGAIPRLQAVVDGSGAAQDKRTAEVALAAYRTSADGFAFPYGDVSIAGWRNGPYVVAQNMGSYLDTPKFLDGDHPVKTRGDAEAYLARLAAWSKQLDGETARLKADRARGVIAPDFILDKTLGAMTLTRGEAPAQMLVVTSLAKKTAGIPGDWTAQATRIVERGVMPALARQIAELKAHRPLAMPDAGAWKLPQGDAYYAWALRAATTTRMTPDQVHAEGLRQHADYHRQMDVILRSMSLTQGSVGARMRALNKDPRFTFASGDEGRAQILKFIEGRIADIRPRLPRAFHALVRGNVEVRRIAPTEEIGAPGAYGGPGSIDGTIPGRFWINLRDPARHTKYNLPTLTYHEAIPGHVWQGEYNQKLPLLGTLVGGGFSAFQEGWALYAEQLAGELGVYADDDAGRLGYLDSMAFRAARMVVDTGIHAKRWTRDTAREWFAEATGDTIEGVTSEIDRYCVWPGQACGYKVGHSEINRQRDRAKAALGARFDYRAFNDMVVGGGSRPLSIVASDTDRMIGKV